jgi:hypothetical protein
MPGSDTPRLYQTAIHPSQTGWNQLTILTTGWRLSPAIFAHICRGMSLEAAITDNANISGSFTYRC